LAPPSDIVSILLLRRPRGGRSQTKRALEFVRRELGDFDIERTELIGGDVVVSCAMATLLEPAHA
jgi:hypothetical protein